ncbi:MAG TPA: hypothetical protein VJ302_15745 [Blastocatellia bacterium]|nr:hypothetical protein [Blastocatellia bacterium]
MAIGPRYSIGKNKRRLFASKEFTDREIPREIFQRAVEELERTARKDREYKVLVYYGVGGVGKSSLQKQLQMDLVKLAPSALYSFVDFVDPLHRNPSRALLELKRNAVCHKKQRFIHFELAYSIYFKKKNPDYVFNKKKLPYEEEASILGEILGALDGLGIVGAVTGIVSKAYDLYSKYELNDDVKEDLQQLESLSAFEIEEQLPAFLAFDIKRIFDKKEASIAVIFLDTYEALWADNKSEASRFTKDSWVRELIAQIPGILFVIFGRERVRWEEQNAEWGRYLNQCLLDNFDQADADDFLIACGVRDAAVRSKMILASAGHPYHLDLSVDTYFELLNQGVQITPEHFGSDRREIFDRFLRYLAPVEIETLKLLAIPRLYNYDVFKYLVRREHTGYPLTQFEEFNRFSFISSDDRFYHLHNLMRNGLNHFQEKSQRRRIHKLMADYYDKKLKKAVVGTVSQDRIIHLLSEAQYHRSHHLKRDQFIDWLSIDKLSILRYLQFMGAASFLETALSDIAERIGIDALGITLFTIYVDMIHLRGQFPQSADLIEGYLARYDKQVIIDSDELLHLYIRKIQCQMFYRPVPPLIEELINIEQLIDKGKFPARYNEVLFMIGGNLGVLSGGYRFSRKWLVKSIRYALEYNHTDYLCRSLRKYSDVLRFYGHLKIANKICDWALSIAREQGYRRYEIYLLCSKAEIAREQKAHATTLFYLKDIEVMVTQQGMKPWLAHTHIAFGEHYIGCEDYSIARSHLLKAEQLYNDMEHAWGQLQVQIGIARCDLGDGMSGWKKRAISALKKALEMGYTKEESMLTLMLEQNAIVNNKLMFL